MPEQTLMRDGRTIAPRAPLDAYREDLRRRGTSEGFGRCDATWLAVATILSHAVDVSPDSRPPLLPTLREVIGSDPALRDVLIVSEVESPGEFELDGVSPIVRAIVDQMEDEGALNLAYSMLSIVADADVRLGVLERGRVVAQLGRVAWKAGALETAREHYRRTEVLGRAARSTELRVRAWIGYSIIARLRGNYPEVRKWSARAAAAADRAELVTLSSLAYHSLLVAAAVAGDFDTALVYGWRAFQSAVGDPVREAQMLLDLSQLLFDSGHPEPAAQGFVAALARRPPSRVALPALGGLARAAAALGDRARVRLAQAKAERVIAGASLPYDSASALLELSQALGAIGDPTGAAHYSARALEIAGRHSFHEIAHRTEELRMAHTGLPAEPPHALDARAIEVARAVTSLGVVSDLVGVD